MFRIRDPEKTYSGSRIRIRNNECHQEASIAGKYFSFTFLISSSMSFRSSISGWRSLTMTAFSRLFFALAACLTVSAAANRLCNSSDRIRRRSFFDTPPEGLVVARRKAFFVETFATPLFLPTSSDGSDVIRTSFGVSDGRTSREEKVEMSWLVRVAIESFLAKTAPVERPPDAADWRPARWDRDKPALESGRPVLAVIFLFRRPMLGVDWRSSQKSNYFYAKYLK